ILGAGVSWIVVPGLRTYGQFLLDELTASLIGEADARNKWGTLVGLHAVDLLPTLAVRFEYARLRPYLYSHRSPRNAYAHFGDVLGHPIGPNARDFLLTADLRPHPRIAVGALGAFTQRGRN